MATFSSAARRGEGNIRLFGEIVKERSRNRDPAGPLFMATAKE